MIANVPWPSLSHLGSNAFHIDYCEGTGAARRFFPLEPNQAKAALETRRARRYPRVALAAALDQYLGEIGVPAKARANAAALADDDTYCIITGQQAGFMGGPAYTAFKIATTIRLAASWQERLGVRIVPMFWLASEDHDLQEINHAFYQQSDGEIGRVAFGWEEEGMPVADMPLHEEVWRTWDAYWEAMRGQPQRDAAMAAMAPRDDEGYARWQARVWSSMFAGAGLVVFEPSVLRPLGGRLMAQMAGAEHAIGRGLQGIAARLQSAGYQPALDPEAYGCLFVVDGSAGRRIRVPDGPAVAQDVERHPQRYSTDAALRPVFADAILPVLANVLGPGELAYHAMLGPVYKALDVPQPVAFPRKSYTLVTTEEANRLAAYGTSPRSILQQAQEPSDAADSLASREHRRLFRTARRQIEEAYEPLKDYVVGQDPNLAKTWESTLGSAKRALDKLEDRAIKAALSRQGLSKGDFRALRNVLLPRDRLQERVYPLAWYLARCGLGLLDDLLTWGELDAFQHEIVTWEDQGADM